MVIVLSSLGGIVAFISGVILLLRAVFGAVTVIRENTSAVRTMDETLRDLVKVVDQNTIDIAVLKALRRRLCTTSPNSAGRYSPSRSPRE